MATFNPPITPDEGASVEYDYRIKENNFGDGYEVRLVDGIKPIFENWNVHWTLLTEGEKEAIREFLNETALGGATFQWYTPNGETKNFRLGGFSSSRQSTTWSVAVKLKEVSDS